MAEIHLFRAGLFYPFLKTITDFGEDAEKYMKRARIPALILDDPTMVSAGYPVRALIADIDRRLQIDGFGYIAGKRYGLEMIRPISEHARSRASTLREFLGLFCSLQDRLISHPVHTLEPDQAGLFICRKNSEGFPLGKDNMEQFIVAQYIKMIRDCLGKNWEPRQIWLQRDDEQKLLNRRAAVYRGNRLTRIFIPNEDLSTPLAPTEEVPLRLTSLKQKSTTDHLKLALLPYCGDTIPTLDDAVELTGISKRSLQRDLTIEGTSFRDVQAGIRFNLAKNLLAGNLPIKEISHRLDYSSQGHFTRAFRNWSSMTPQQYRQQLQTS